MDLVTEHLRHGRNRASFRAMLQRHKERKRMRKKLQEERAESKRRVRARPGQLFLLE